MNDIRPFKGLRYNESAAGPLGKLISPPYDVISNLEQLDLHGRSTHNVVRLEFGFQYPEDDKSDSRYTRAAALLQQWISEGVLRPEDDESIYLYEQQFTYEGATLTRRGVLAALRLAPWEEGVVLPHEETLAGPKVDRLELMRATACNLSPLYLLFDDPSGGARREMESITRRAPDAMADAGDGQLHRLWVLPGHDHAALLSALRQPQLYMADGHHRYETALAYMAERRAADPQGSPDAPYNFALVLLVDATDPGLVVLPTHRLIHDVDPKVLAGLDAALSASFEAEEMLVIDSSKTEANAATALRVLREAEERGPALALYRAGSITLLRPRQSPAAPASGRPLLDVDILHEGILGPMLGIDAERLKAGTNVAYTRDAVEALSAVDQETAQAAFLMNPTRVEQVLETARAKGKMPQKSTYFYPKPATGLVIKQL
ncbi:MAG TPA: DUF1015 domain-containing protein [Chloroflexota bacterium]|nr:DUF1015 domain-containing protein [Chloroflexota bacterium]